MKLCEACQSISEAFFGPQVGPKVAITVPHWPVTTLHHSAASGCPLGKVIAAGANVSFLPPDLQASLATRLQRALLDPYQAFGVYLGIDDVSHAFYFHVPPKWCKSISTFYFTSASYTIH
jgi:hypothetical protein